MQPTRSSNASYAAVVLAAALAVASCSSLPAEPAPPPPIFASVDVRVRKLLPETQRTGLPPVRIIDSERMNGYRATYYEDGGGWIGIDGDSVQDVYAVAHELAHWHIDGTPHLSPLPIYLHEGIAEWVACEVTGMHEARLALIDEERVEMDLPKGWERLRSVDGLKAAQVWALTEMGYLEIRARGGP